MDVYPNSKDFKILQLSNATWCGSGYGVQSKNNLFEWNKYYNVRQICNYGLEAAWMNVNGLVHYPCLPGDNSGDKTARLIFSSWKPDLFITLYDIWMGAYVDPAPAPQMFTPIHNHWIPIVMVDHSPIPESTLVQAASAFKIVVPTRYAENEFKRNGVDCRYIPFAFDMKNLHPSEDKAKDKAWLQSYSLPVADTPTINIDKDTFVISMVGANKDPYRKGYPRGLIALQIFFEQNPDARRNTCLYIHTWLRMSRDIPHAAKVLGVWQNCRGPSDYNNLCSANDKDMARIYGATDLFLHPSEGGGFEAPLVEAMACSVPVICSDFICMSELGRDHGWLIPPIVGKSGAKSLYMTPLDAAQQIDDEYLLAAAIEEAYSSPDKCRKFGEAGRKFAEGFDMSLVNPEWIRFFEEIRSDWRSPPLENRKL